MSCQLTEKQMSLLCSSALFTDVPPQTVAAVLERDGCTLEEYPAGTSIYQPDRFRRSLGILLAGQVRVSKPPLTVSVLKPGSLFGAAALYNRAAEYASTLTALSPCTALLLSEELLDALLSEQTLLRQNYLRYLTGRIRFLSARLHALATSGAELRLGRYLLSNTQNGSLTCSATELSKRLGLSRASLYRAFSTLEDAGIILREGKTIRVPDLAALDDIVMTAHITKG